MVGEKIRQLIESQGKMPKTEVAEKMGISATNLHLLMKKESVETKYLESLGQIFGVPINYFFDDSKPKSKAPSAQSRKFGDDVMEFLKDQIRQKDAVIMELIQRVGKFESVGYPASFVLLWVTDWPTLLA